MMKKTRLAVLMSALAWGGAFAAGTAVSHAALPESGSVVAREAAQSASVNTLPADDQLARRKPRVPGGSGCDDPRDLIEHPECVLGNAAPADDHQLARRKPRVPGGSGCDDPRDLIEHPECSLVSRPLDKELLAREASEGPRGGDNERPGDRQRRRGRS